MLVSGRGALGELTVAAVFTIGHSGIAELLLGLDDIIDLLVLHGSQFRLLGLTGFVGKLGIEK
jgi:hypothetical protein